MAVLKLSEITASAGNFTAGDFLLSVQGGTTDVRMSRAQTFGFPTFQLGDPDAASPVAQTLQVQSVVAGTTDTAGTDWTFVGSKGTGTGAGGSIIFKTAPAGSTGTTQNAARTVLTLDSTGNATLLAGARFVAGTNATGVAIGINNLSNTGWGYDGPNSSPAAIVGGTVFGGFSTNGSYGVAHIYLGATVGALDIVLTRIAAANLQFGNNDAAAPVAQTLQVQSVVAGTTNTAGVDWTFVGSKGTGTGAGGAIIFKTAPAGSTGTTQNTAVTAMQIGSTGAVTITEQVGSSALTLTGATQTASNPALNITQTWNNAGTTFTAALISVTKTAANSASKYLDVKVGGSSVFYVQTDSVYSNLQVANASGAWFLTSTAIQAASSNAFQWSSRGIITSPAAGGVQFGAADAAAPVAQTTQVQSVVAGTSNTAGVDWTIQGSRGTGTGVGGKILFKTAAAGTTGTTQNSAATQLTIDGPGNVVTGNAAIATDATDGFLYIPTCAGTPTGTPTTYTGRVAIVYDTTGNKFYVYNGAWKGGTAPGAWS